jgi:uncharacterized membrane protein YkvA (DUF1232 family)
MPSSRTRQVILGIVAVAIGAIYLVNPTAGVLELIPDMLPFVGNLDEAGATALLIYGIRELRGSQPKQLPGE